MTRNGGGAGTLNFAAGWDSHRFLAVLAAVIRRDPGVRAAADTGGISARIDCAHQKRGRESPPAWRIGRPDGAPGADLLPPNAVSTATRAALDALCREAAPRGHRIETHSAHLSGGNVIVREERPLTIKWSLPMLGSSTLAASRRAAMTARREADLDLIAAALGPDAGLAIAAQEPA